MIRELRARGHEVVLGGHGRSQEFLKREFPELACLDFPGITLRYPAGKSFYFFYASKIPGFLWRIVGEHRRLRRLVLARRFSMVISDGRLGLFTRLCPSVLITHQLFVKCPAVEFAGFAWGRWLETVVYWILRLFYRRFDQIWVPDFASPPDLSGELSHRRTRLKNIRFIGPLCRFPMVSRPDASLPEVDCLALVSGPEPQRTIFEGKIRALLADLPGRHVIVLGKPDESRSGGQVLPGEWESGLFFFPHADEKTLGRLIRRADLIITRPGYTTVMELAGLNARRIVFVPTPGQLEQMYLARYLERRRIAPWRDQNRLSRESLRFDAARYRGFEDFRRLEMTGWQLPLETPGRAFAETVRSPATTARPGRAAGRP
jgi:hypothetical protein